MSPCLSFFHPCLSFSLSVAVSLPIFLSPTMPLFFCDSLSLSYPRLSLSPVPIFLSLSNPGLSSYLYPSLSLSLSCSYLSLSLSPTPVFLSLSLSLSLSLFLPHLYLRSLSLSLSIYLSPTPVFLLIFLSHTLSLFSIQFIEHINNLDLYNLQVYDLSTSLVNGIKW